MADIDISRRNKKPRLLLESEREKLEEFIDSIHYSARYCGPDLALAKPPADKPQIFR